MLTRRFLTIYGIVGIIVMAALLVLVAFKLVRTEYFLPLFLIAFVIWASRIVLRMLISRKEREEAANQSHPPAQ